MKYLLILVSSAFYGQGLHHQMVSAQGSTKKMQDGTVVMQTIGQASTTGTASVDYVVQQGFQQSYWGRYIASNTRNLIKVTTYPNPFIQTVNFEFSEDVSEELQVTIFDITGRLIFAQNKKNNSSLFSILLPDLTSGEYLVRLNTSTFSLYTKIMKL